VGAFDEGVHRLASAPDAGTDDEAAVRAAVQDVERRTEERAARRGGTAVGSRRHGEVGPRR